MGVSHLSMIIATILLLLLILEAQCDTSQGHKLHLNYVKPYKHTTCPGDPCLTLEEYRNAADDYFLSDSEFIFIPGDYIFHG